MAGIETLADVLSVSFFTTHTPPTPLYIPLYIITLYFVHVVTVPTVSDTLTDPAVKVKFNAPLSAFTLLGSDAGTLDSKLAFPVLHVAFGSTLPLTRAGTQGLIYGSTVVLAFHFFPDEPEVDTSLI